MLNALETFQGRKLGIVLTDGADAALFNGLKKAVEKAQGTVEIITPEIGGVSLSDNTHVPANQNIKGGPSVLYDAVALIMSAEEVQSLMKEPALRDFICHAFAHFKFIGFSAYFGRFDHSIR
jgi:catalase